MNRFGAFLVHLGISLVIFAVLAAVVVFVWYPDFFFTTDGGWQGIRIIAAVDLVLGPVLTLIVFNRAKPRAELARDLTIIGVVQATCLVAGTYVVYSERPLALVYSDGQFHSVSADSYTSVGLNVPDLSGLPGSYPKQVVVDVPRDRAEQSNIRRLAYEKGVPLRALAELYVPLTHERLNADKEAIDLAHLEQLDRGAQTVSRWLADHGGTFEDYDFFPYGARYEYVFLAVSRHSREIVGLLKIPRMGREPAQG